MLNHNIEVGLEVRLDDVFSQDTRNQFARVVKIDSYGEVRPGFAEEQIRLCTPATRSEYDLAGRLLGLKEGVESCTHGRVTYHVGDNEVARPRLALWDSHPYKALLNFLQAPDEGGKYAAELLGMANTNALIVDFDVTEDESQLLKLNLLNLLAPTVLSLARPPLRSRPRQKPWAWSASRERLPQFWQWCSDWTAQERVESLARMVGYQEERAANRDALGSGVCHFAQRLRLGSREVLRFWALPGMCVQQAVAAVAAVDSWLEEAVGALGRENPKTAAEAVKKAPSFNGCALVSDPSVRLYQLLRY